MKNFVLRNTVQRRKFKHEKKIFYKWSAVKLKKKNIFLQKNELLKSSKKFYKHSALKLKKHYFQNNVFSVLVQNVCKIFFNFSKVRFFAKKCSFFSVLLQIICRIFFFSCLNFLRCTVLRNTKFFIMNLEKMGLLSNILYG